MMRVNEDEPVAEYTEDMAHEVIVTDGPPWGFRIAGGADVYKPIMVSRVTPGSPASKCGLKSGDVILRLNGIALKELKRQQVEEMIVNAQEKLELNVTSTELHVPHGTPTAANPAWVAMAKELDKPRQIGEEAKEGGLVTQGRKFGGDKHPVHVTNTTPSIFAARRSAQSAAMQQQLQGKMICQECRKPIGSGEYTTVSGYNFHTSCFHCSAPNCQGRLDRGYLIENERPYCADCHDKYFARPCARCGRAIVGQVYHALNNQWHMDCFKCFVCRQPFLDGVFYMEEGKLYCDKDHKRLFTTTCDTCGGKIGPGDKEIKIGNRKWHDRCFHCQRCGVNLNGKMFVRKNDLPMCQQCSSL